MRGHIRRRTDNSWAVILYTGKGLKGKPKYKWHPIKGDEEDAERYRTELLHQMDTNTYVNPNKITVEEYLKRWLRDYAEPNLSHTTYDSYKMIVDKHLIPFLGNHLLAKLQPMQVQEYYSHALKNGNKKKYGKKSKKKRTDLSPATVLKHHRVLREALKHAVQWQLVGRNICDAVSPPKTVKPDKSTLDKDEIKALLEASRELDIFVPVAIAAYTGMRRGEILALKWKNIDLGSKIIQVRQAIIWNREKKVHELKRTKTEHNRKVNIPAQLVEILTHHKKVTQNRDKLALGKDYKKNDFVCTMPGGLTMGLDHLTKAFSRLSKKCKFGISLHDLRHSHATILLKMNVPPKVVAERLGHANTATTLEVYSHVTPSMQLEAVEKIERLFGS